MAAKKKGSRFVVYSWQRPRGKQYVYEHAGRTHWGPKRIATTYRSRVEAERVSHSLRTVHGYRSEARAA